MSSKLTKIFTQLADMDVSIDSLGAQILSFLREKDCRTLDQANEQFGKAYDESGWSRTAGRPKDGAKEVSAPPTVKNYVSTFRKAYKLDLDVLAFRTTGEMRQAVRDAKVKVEAQDKPASLIGVQVSKEDVLTGALVHDIYACIKSLPEGERDEFEAKLRKVLAQAVKKAPPELKLVA